MKKNHLFILGLTLFSTIVFFGIDFLRKRGRAFNLFDLKGEIGIAIKDFPEKSYKGVVKVKGIKMKAHSQGRKIEKGEEVIISEITTTAGGKLKFLVNPLD